MPTCDSIQDVRSLSEHSPNCQLRLSLEKDYKGQSSQIVMECCTSPTNQMASLEVATLNPAIEIAPISTQSTQTSLEDTALSVATSVEDISLHVTMPNSMDILQSLTTTHGASLQSDTDKVLFVTTTVEHVTTPLDGVINEKSITKPANLHSRSKTDADQQILPVATKTNLSYEQFLSQYQENHSLSTDNKAARRTSSPHLWKHSESEPELAVAIQSQDADITHEQSPEPEFEISHIIRVATDVLCSL